LAQIQELHGDQAYSHGAATKKKQITLLSETG
jgi:hypothetical protein